MHDEIAKKGIEIKVYLTFDMDEIVSRYSYTVKSPNVVTSDSIPSASGSYEFHVGCIVSMTAGNGWYFMLSLIIPKFQTRPESLSGLGFLRLTVLAWSIVFYEWLIVSSWDLGLCLIHGVIDLTFSCETNLLNASYRWTLLFRHTYPKGTCHAHYSMFRCWVSGYTGHRNFTWNSPEK